MKKTYAAIVSSSRKPDLFLDVGANYGTHSLLFLAHGIRTWSFEPNARCHPYFIESCGLNAFNPHLEQVAISSQGAKQNSISQNTIHGMVPSAISLLKIPKRLISYSLLKIPKRPIS